MRRPSAMGLMILHGLSTRFNQKYRLQACKHERRIDEQQQNPDSV
jgi:hypothetical protein